jgi:hypothetical protein
MNYKIKYVCSLGFNCHTAQFLKSNDLKFVSYPFDWVMSNLSVVKKSIEDNFTVFLDKNNYTDLNMEQRCGHKIYCENMFVHHNPLKNENDYQYFNRCVNRFRDLLKKKEKKLFIISIINGEHGVGNVISDEIKNEFIEFNNFLKNYTTKYKLLIIVNYPNKICNNHKITHENNCIFLEIDTLSKCIGTHYENEIDNEYLHKTILQIFKFNLKK